jgi:protein phosphatase
MSSSSDRPTDPVTEAQTAELRVEAPSEGTPATIPMVVDVAALSDRGAVRENNEDAYLVFRMGRYMERVTSSLPEAELPSRYEAAGHLMIVADGLGGHEAGDVASRTALTTALDLILRSPRWALQLDDPATRDSEIRAMSSRARGYLARVHETLHARAAADSKLSGMGTTLTGLYAIGSDAFVIHVGDSKAYVLREGELRQVTHDHTVAQEYADRGMIRQDEVATHRLQHVLTRAVGGPGEHLDADMHHLRIEDGDRWLLCSDGLTDMASEPEIAEVMRAHPVSAEAARALVDLALARGGHDNITAIVAHFRAGS